MKGGLWFLEKQEKHRLLTNIAVTSVLMTLATAAAAAFFHYSQNSTSVAIVYVLTVMLVARYTSGYVPGIVASVVGVVCVNYVFTYPFMKMNFTMDGYPVTFMGMMVVSGITSTLTTRFKRQSQLLNEREKLLMEAEKETMRANLLRAVSHDLRTPLTAVIGLASAYLEEGSRLSEEEKAHMVKGIQEEAGWLLNMVENLLSVTRIRVGDVKIATSPEPLEEVVSEAVQRFRKRLPQAVVHVRVPEEFLMVPMDAALIEQVIINLLENAVYHSGVEGDIDLFVERVQGELEFHVRDYGNGIRPERLARIFDGAGMESNESGDSHKGMGIGLTICKTIITAHQGIIQAFNRDQGAEFIFTLPLGEEQAYDEQTYDPDH
ncbi:MAG: PAS domain-containing sensor histidine kinase [Lachnospiraceae bacterium]|jgi:two-component system sensor histidine kinase KdpD|nr:PAS domain-containing sensor histidine kinase [Lachnospiraceae bacterium]